MDILAVDDNKFALDELTNDLGVLCPGDTIHDFTLPSRALEYVLGECVSLDVAFLDVEMPGMTGIELATRIKMKFPRVIIIFVTAYPQYSLDAFKIHANGYLLKPASREMLKRELNELTSPFISVPQGRVRVHTFGNFEIYADEKPVRFARSKSKELLAYLVDRRGAFCTMNELCAVLFDEDGDGKAQQSHVRNLISDIRTTLAGVGAEKIFIKEHNAVAVDTDEIDCDYYRMLDGEPTAINQFLGEYMSNYGWSEITVGALLDFVPDEHTSKC